MSETLKRRPVPRYLFFPLIFAVLLLVAAKLVALQRANLIDHLTDRIAHAEPRQAQAAVRHLAAMPDPPMPELVAAAASPNGEIADEAQHAIGEVLRSVQRNVDADRRSRQSAYQLASLADSLVDHQGKFPESDHAWLGRTTRRVIQLANQLPIGSTPLIASQCDAVLASIAPSEITTSAFVAIPVGGSVTPGVMHVAIPAPAAMLSQQRMLEERYAALSSRPFPSVASVARESSATGTHEAMITPATERSSASSFGDSARSNSNIARQAEWSHPVFFPVPAMPIEAVPLPTHESSTDGNTLRGGMNGMPNRLGGNEIELSQVDSRELLAQWLVADGPEVETLEQELARRGFGRLSPQIVEQFFSANVEDRLRLVDQVLAEPGVDARPWMMLLAEDPSADVRLMIVTIMATSNDSELIEKAWEVAIHDRDPRVASLADRLRERRSRGQSF